MGLDLGRKGCATEALIFKVKPQPQGSAIKSLVALYSFEDMHTRDQVINIKKLFYKYKIRRIAFDGNGIGIIVLDEMIKSQVDEETGEYYPSFGVYNDDEKYYRKYIKDDTEQDAIFVIKGNAPINTACYSITQSWLRAGKIKFLIDPRTARNKLLGTQAGKNMTPEQRNEYLMPYELTSILRDQLLNLHEENEGVNIILKQVSKKIKKDKCSALFYAMYYLHEEEEKGKKKKNRDFSKWKFYN